MLSVESHIVKHVKVSAFEAITCASELRRHDGGRSLAAWNVLSEDLAIRGVENRRHDIVFGL